MYGQTEATARMACLPPHLADRPPRQHRRPDPGRLVPDRPVPESAEPGVGELVYAGPNVMLGYAEQRGRPGAAGRELTELRTGDLARERRRPLRGRRAPRPARQAVRAAARPRPGRAARLGTRARPRSGAWSSTTLLHAFTTRPRATGRLRDRIVAAGGLPPTARSGSPRSTRSPHRERQADLAALDRQARLGAPVERGRRARATAGRSPPRAGARRLRPRARPARRRPRRQLRRPRRRLALLRRARHPAGRPGSATCRPTGTPAPSTSSSRPADRAPRRTPRLETRWCCARWRSSPSSAPTPTCDRRRGRPRAARRRRLQLRPLPARRRPRAAGDAPRSRPSLAQVVVPGVALDRRRGAGDRLLPPATAVFLNGAARQRRLDRRVAVLVPRGAGVGDRARLWRCIAVPGVRPAGAPVRRTPSLSAWSVAALAVRFAWVGLEAGTTERYTVGVVALWFVALGWAAARADTPRPPVARRRRWRPSGRWASSATRARGPSSSPGSRCWSTCRHVRVPHGWSRRLRCSPRRRCSST